MPEEKSEIQKVEPGHPINHIAGELADPNHVTLLAATHKITRMDVAIAYANAAAHILATANMPRETAMARIADLHEIMVAAYDLKVHVDGPGKGFNRGG